MGGQHQDNRKMSSAGNLPLFDSGHHGRTLSTGDGSQVFEEWQKQAASMQPQMMQRMMPQQQQPMRQMPPFNPVFAPPPGLSPPKPAQMEHIFL